MPRGGPRPGSGRKPGSRNAVVLGMDGGRRNVEATAGSLVVPDGPPLEIEPPEGLTDAQVAYWRKHAPRAIRQRTLTDAEVPGFVELCELAAMKNQIARAIEAAKAGAATGEEVDKLLGHFIKFSARVDAALARFKLTAFGKPAMAEKPKVQANPWAKVAAQ